MTVHVPGSPMGVSSVRRVRLIGLSSGVSAVESVSVSTTRCASESELLPAAGAELLSEQPESADNIAAAHRIAAIFRFFIQITFLPSIGFGNVRVNITDALIGFVMCASVICVHFVEQTESITQRLQLQEQSIRSSDLRPDTQPRRCCRSGRGSGTHLHPQRSRSRNWNRCKHQ